MRDGKCIEDVFKGVVMQLTIKFKLIKEGHGWGREELKSCEKMV